mgnify:CR=1 FL=1
MRVLVVHASQFGATKGIAERITQVLGRHGLTAEACPVTELATLTLVDAVVIGSRIIQLIEPQPRTQVVETASAFLREIRAALDA